MKKYLLAGLFTLFASQSNAAFIEGVTDTDMIEDTPVPAPAGLALVALGLLFSARKRQSI
ncbi:MAG TPA: hypothetical protein DGF36_08010 [Alteromonas sp.]|nr:hypothetical protein [Alteromonas sp.]|tara:strand:- start:1284 stop:1463 length:180 start_codon:yes stop_codon:yes gene_type:complete